VGDASQFDAAAYATTPLDGDAPNLGEYQRAIVERGPVAKLLVGETRVAVDTLEARIARLLTILHPAEEGGKGPVQPGQYVLQDLGVKVVVLGPYLLDGGQLRALMGTGDAHPALVPGIAAFLKGGIVEFAAAPQHKRHLVLLLRRGQELYLKVFRVVPGVCLSIGFYSV
jgi:hypothetical protein